MNIEETFTVCFDINLYWIGGFAYGILTLILWRVFASWLFYHGDGIMFRGEYTESIVVGLVMAILWPVWLPAWGIVYLIYLIGKHTIFYKFGEKQNGD